MRYVKQIPLTLFLDAKVLYFDFDREGKTFSSGCVRVSERELSLFELLSVLFECKVC